MGRSATGIQTTNGAKRIELSYLLKNKMIKKGAQFSGQMNWKIEGEPAGNIGIETRYFGDGSDFLRLHYTVILNEVKTNYDYKISLIEKDSNLGKGKVLYMICNHSGQLCRILYLAYGSHYFKCRQAYQNKLYYPVQQRSKSFRYNSRFYDLQEQLETEDQKRYTEKYNGRFTKRYIRKQRLEGLYIRMNDLRNIEFMEGIRKAGFPLKFDFFK